MPNINDINGVTVANIAKLDAVLKANIDKVNGLTLSAATGLLADYPGAAAAYSTRQLLSTVTVAMRIRRSGDDIEADVEFDSNNEISLTSPISNASSGTYTDLADFVDHSTTPRDAFVDEWKDQSGSGNHAAQATAAHQPKLYDATTGLITVDSGGKPALFCTDSSDGFSAAAGAIDVTSRTIYQWSVYSLTGTGNYPTITPSALYEGHNVSTEIPRTGTNRATFTAVNAASAINTNQAYLRHSYADTTDFKTFLDGSGTAIISGTDTNADWATSGLQIFDTNFGATGELKLSEFIMWQSDQSSNRTGVESNINSDYLIYQPTDAPTSGLLATYTGAAAAYSVRQLSDKAVIAMRIRRDSDDEERNIGFDSNGDLDTTAISDFCGTANGYVVEWADQSINGNHATQPGQDNQPQIYNGTAVITENGKPILRSTSLDRFQIPISQTSAFDIYSVSKVDGQSIFMGNTNGGGDFLLAAQSGSTSSSISANVTLNSARRNGSSHTFGNRGDIFTNFGSQHLMYLDASFSFSASGTQLLGYYVETSWQMWSAQELIFYPNTVTHTPSDVESNINTYFSIY